MPLTPEQRRILAQPYNTFAPEQTFQIGNKKLTVKRKRTIPPQKVVRGLDRVKEIKKDIPNISSKGNKSCHDCFWCYTDTTHRMQVLTNKMVSYRCHQQGGIVIDPDTEATSAEKFGGYWDKQCPWFTHRKRFK